ncbi:MAG TPA: helix-turn-helix domain-containing protein [Solirubrobacterales bacterium]|nr:helix-turn-helix domain-containing protein [Solirubrobacterales bacterium]
MELLAQARMAARHGVDLATVLRRYFAGYAILEEFAAAELAGTGLSRDAVQRAFRARAVAFDRLIGAVSRDYRRERDEIPDPVDGRRVESVGRLLAGELLDAPELNYDLSVRHLGLVAAGASVDEPLRHLARGLDCRVLLVRPDGDTTWAWLGARRPIEAGAALSALLDARKEEVTIALGEPGGGLDGWRLTHLQAKAALPVALRTGKPLVRYADVALVAAAQRNELLTASLFRLYLKPLDDGKGRGATLRATLRAYLAAGCNASSAASALGTRRQTVARRLREIESKLGRPIDGCLGELDLALRLEAQVGPPVDAQGHGVCAI